MEDDQIESEENSRKVLADDEMDKLGEMELKRTCFTLLTITITWDGCKSTRTAASLVQRDATRNCRWLWARRCARLGAGGQYSSRCQGKTRQSSQLAAIRKIVILPMGWQHGEVEMDYEQPNSSIPANDEEMRRTSNSDDCSTIVCRGR